MSEQSGIAASRASGFDPGLQRLAGKRALVTGAGSGIGAATAVLFAREGAKVGLMGRRPGPLDEVATRITGEGGLALALPCDVSKEPEVEAAVKELVDTWGGLDACVASAGIEPWDSGDASVDQLDLAVWNEVISINLTGMFLTCKHAIRALLHTGGGSMVIIGSPTGIYGSALGQTAYSASKAGCHGLVRVIANEYAGAGIRVNCVVPGFIDTPLTAGVFDDDSWLERVRGSIPQRRPGRPDEVASMNLWLCSEESSYATGAFFVIDGGLTSI